MMLKRIGGFIFHGVLPLAVLGGAVASVVMLGAKPKANRKKAPPRISVPVDIVRARPHSGVLKISASGTVVPFREVALATEVSGQVTWKSDSLLAGNFVNKGEELLKIDAVDYELEVARIKQQLARADSDLVRVAVDKENAERLIELARQTLDVRTREFERMKRLKSSRASSNTEYDAAEKQYVEARQEVTAQENQLRSLEAQSESLQTLKRLETIGLEKAQRDLDRTVIRAPFSGVVIEHMAETNAHVQAGETIAKIEDTSRVEVSCNLRKQDLEFLPMMDGASTSRRAADAYRLPPVPVTVRYTRAGRQFCWDGVLSRQDGLGMDERTRTMPVRMLVDDPLSCSVDSGDPTARPIALVRGMFVTVDLHCTPDRPLLAIPEDAIRPGKTVWLMENERLRIRPIHIVRIEDGMAYVDGRGGQVSQNHAIIRSPVPGAKDGLVVTVNVPRPAGKQASGKGPGAKGSEQQPQTAPRPDKATAKSNGKSSAAPAGVEPLKLVDDKGT